MKITLLGYMGSGKSTIGRFLSKKLNYTFYDLDELIEQKEGQSIPSIFKEKGEVYFRKLENQILKDTLRSDSSFILALGGGTPVFYDSMDFINQYSESFYLSLTPKELSKRLYREKSKRPIISHLNDEELEEFIAKHLFERNPYYSKAKYKVEVKEKEVPEVALNITQILNQR
ncbi:MAG: AAA family ATPase [Flavobacteriales bacterium]|nr:AAA family ATPase [Flavobacteriales bacterium]